MGRTSKFSFPIPGRKRSSSKDQALQAPRPVSRISSGNLSKAEQILGTSTAVPDWRRPETSSRISISVSESTQSTRSMNDNRDNYDQLEGESGVFGRPTGVRGRASSNALCQRFGEDVASETSSTTRRLRNEDSTSTLKSHYDRHKLPPAISQQTSASSARDLALRKGLSPVVNRSPHLQGDSVDSWDQAGQSLSGMNDNHLGSPERKRSVRLGLSSLFHRSEKRTSVVPQNSLDPCKQTGSVRNRLVKAVSKESLQSQRPSTRPIKSRDQRDQMQGQTNDGCSYNSYDHYEHSARNPHMNSIPESNAPELFNLFPKTPDNTLGRQPGSLNSEKREGRRRLEDLHSSPGEKDALSWKNVRSNTNGYFRNSMISQSTGHSSLGVSSTGSISSHNTKTSRQTGGSVFSSADLQQSSILSLSSDSEEDLSDNEPTKSHDNRSTGKAPSHAESEIIPPALQQRWSTTTNPPKRPSGLKRSSTKSRKSAARSSVFLTIPESTAGLSKRPTPPTITRPDSVNSQESQATSSLKKRTTSSKKSTQQQQPTPPLSPKETDAGTSSVRTTSSGRMMQVTQQEEALLEALRQKRARMRQRIIEEHKAEAEGKSSPGLVKEKQRASSRFSKASSTDTDTIRSGTERVPLILDAPILKARGARNANGSVNGSVNGYARAHRRGNSSASANEYGREPSPDISDFLTFDHKNEEVLGDRRAVSRNGGEGWGKWTWTWTWTWTWKWKWKWEWD
ncbi:hypothetical protein NHQ30_001492 [Ciborinia camelliae]|nr:hypothetical protein NHQ30_001492 [Ciborinia camelliae]